MEKFSNITKREKKVIEDTDFKYDGYLKVKELDGWEFVVEADCAIMIPHIIDFDEFIFRKEYVPPYQYAEPNKQFFLTIVSGTMEKGESAKDTVIRELQEECGIKLNTTYNGFVHFGDYFMSKGNSAKYHVYYIPLQKNDFTIVTATGDGSEAEEKSSNIRIDKKNLIYLKPSDTITAYCIEKILNELND